MTTTTELDPIVHDTAIAALYERLAKAQQEEARAESRIIHSVGPKERLWGKETKRGWGSEEIWYSLDEALDLCKDTQLLEALDLTQTVCAEVENELANMEAQYTGWSRFFLVTSSPGHVHSSMRCTTCFKTTQYGWLPEYSGKDEATAVGELGPVLCSVCFPSAPVEDTGAKITQSRAQELAWSSDREARIAARERRETEKREKLAKKAANALKRAETLAPKIDEIINLFGEDWKAAYDWTFSHKGYDTAYHIYSDMLRRRGIR